MQDLTPVPPDAFRAEDRTAALEAGASGYLLKERAVEELIEAIRIMTAGRTYLCPLVARKVAQPDDVAASGDDSRRAACLTPREREGLQLIAESYTTKAIGARLCISVKTVSTHRQHIMDKLDIHDVAGLTRYAIRNGLTSVVARTPAAHRRMQELEL